MKRQSTEMTEKLNEFANMMNYLREQKIEVILKYLLKVHSSENSR